MSYVEKYKKGLAIVAGTLCLIVALYLPAKYAISIEVKKQFSSVWDVWTAINWIFLGLAIIFLWGEIRTLASTFQNVFKKKTQ